MFKSKYVHIVSITGGQVATITNQHFYPFFLSAMMDPRQSSALERTGSNDGSSPHFIVVEANSSGIQIIGDWECSDPEVSTNQTSSTASVRLLNKCDQDDTTNEDDDENTSLSSDDDSVIMTKDPETGQWECKPYKSQLLQAEISQANIGNGKESHQRIVEKLTELGVSVYVVPHQTLGNMLENITHVVNMVAKKNSSCHANCQSCLLYQDQQGRLYNLTVEDHAIGIATRWKACVAGFSGFQAMVCLTVLTRTFSCANDDEIDEKMDLIIRPGTALVLVLGLVFSEETSLSWINAAMFVRGVPSIAAHCLDQFVENDWVRKLMIFTLSLASTYTGTTQRVLTIVGVGLACVALLVNLGARSWHFLKWKPLQYNGLAAPFVAYVAAIGVGLIFPYMGHRGIEVGGKAAIENVVKTALFVGVIFLVSGLDEIREHLVVGSTKCDQKKVNIIVGSWWTATLLMCLYLTRLIPPAMQWPQADGELLLEEDQTSPVGFKVPNLPVFPLKPYLAKQGLSFCTISLEILFGIVVAAGIGGLIIYTAFSEDNDNWFGTLSATL